MKPDHRARIAHALVLGAPVVVLALALLGAEARLGNAFWVLGLGYGVLLGRYWNSSRRTWVFLGAMMLGGLLVAIAIPRAHGLESPVVSGHGFVFGAFVGTVLARAVWPARAATDARSGRWAWARGPLLGVVLPLGLGAAVTLLHSWFFLGVTAVTAGIGYALATAAYAAFPRRNPLILAVAVVGGVVGIGAWWLDAGPLEATCTLLGVALGVLAFTTRAWRVLRLPATPEGGADAAGATAAATDESRAALRQKRRRGRRQAIAVLTVLVGGAAALGAGLTWTGIHDRDNQVSIECDVVAAEFASNSARGPSGAGTTSLFVRIDTEQCGVLTLRRGVDRDTGREVAARFRSGETYRFTVGEASLTMRDWPLSPLGSMMAYGFDRIGRRA